MPPVAQWMPSLGIAQAKESQLVQEEEHDANNTVATITTGASLDCETSRCPICLNVFDDRAVLESCHHEYCFSCITQWSSLSHTCPLCIQPFTSCIHRIQVDENYSTHFFEPRPGRLTAADTVVPHGTIRRLYGAPQWRSRPRNVYRNNLYVRHIGASRVSGFQQITPETFRMFPQRLDRLIPWIRRELQAITTLSATSSNSQQSNVDFTRPVNAYEEIDSGLEIIREYIIAVCKRYDLQTDQGQDLIRDFLHDHTEHFVHELMGFARSPFSMEAYDRFAQYSPLSPFPTVSASSTGTTGNQDNNSQVINSDYEDYQDQQSRRKRRLDSCDHLDHTGGNRNREQKNDERRNQKQRRTYRGYNHDWQPYFYRADIESTEEDGGHSSSSSSYNRHNRNTIPNFCERRNTSLLGQKEVDSTAATNGDDGTATTSSSTARNTELHNILLAKLKREQDIYISRNSTPTTTSHGSPLPHF
ncbi:hypothetical protein FBU30_002749 [Linnemannia zychae]|nr:hypothetical protein FBU30_002749 [Linnemannia zychae]